MVRGENKFNSNKRSMRTPIKQKKENEKLYKITNMMYDPIMPIQGTIVEIREKQKDYRREIKE